MRDRVGTAGLIVAIVALVAALGGGAYAASGGLTSKQKKEVRSIAKAEAGKAAKAGPQGPQGPAGTNGTNGQTGIKGDTGPEGPRGPQGPAGASGPEGAKGAQGVAGTSVTNIPIAPNPANEHCPEGGAQFRVGSGEPTYACNGEGGGGGGYPEHLPAGRTETGYWEVLGESGVVFSGFALTTISFPLPLETEPAETIFLEPATATEEEEEKCPGDPEHPEAAEGVLCLYPSFAGETLEIASPSPFGAELGFAEADKGVGSWAVTAE